MCVGGDWPKEADKGFALAGHDIVEGTIDALGQDQLPYLTMLLISGSNNAPKKT